MVKSFIVVRPSIPNHGGFGGFGGFDGPYFLNVRGCQAFSASASAASQSSSSRFGAPGLSSGYAMMTIPQSRTVAHSMPSDETWIFDSFDFNDTRVQFDQNQIKFHFTFYFQYNQHDIAQEGSRYDHFMDHHRIFRRSTYWLRIDQAIIKVDGFPTVLRHNEPSILDQTRRSCFNSGSRVQLHGR